MTRHMSTEDKKDFRHGLGIIALGLILLYVYFITSPDQTFGDCGGVDVPAHCVE
jgi:hypothetical protein